MSFKPGTGCPPGPGIARHEEKRGHPAPAGIPLAPLLAGAVLMLLGAAGPLTGCSSPNESPQPIAFKHKIHVAEEEIPCIDCHRGAETADHATIPTREICLDCHEEALGDSPEEAKLVELLAVGEPIPWRRVHRLKEHVHFSHRRHVLAGGILCETCHGPVAESEEPFIRPYMIFNSEIGMERCIVCHRKSGNPRATVDCALCHR